MSVPKIIYFGLEKFELIKIAFINAVQIHLD